MPRTTLAATSTPRVLMAQRCKNGLIFDDMARRPVPAGCWRVHNLGTSTLGNAKSEDRNPNAEVPNADLRNKGPVILLREIKPRRATERRALPIQREPASSSSLAAHLPLSIRSAATSHPSIKVRVRPATNSAAPAFNRT